VKETRT